MAVTAIIITRPGGRDRGDSSSSSRFILIFLLQFSIFKATIFNHCHCHLWIRMPWHERSELLMLIQVLAGSPLTLLSLVFISFITFIWSLSLSPVNKSNRCNALGTKDANCLSWSKFLQDHLYLSNAVQLVSNGCASLHLPSEAHKRKCHKVKNWMPPQWQ